MQVWKSRESENKMQPRVHYQTHIPLHSSVPIINIIYWRLPCAGDCAYLISTPSAFKKEEKGSILIFAMGREKPSIFWHQDQ